MSARRFPNEPSPAAAFEAGRSHGALEERERWRKATGVDSPEQFERRKALEEAERSHRPSSSPRRFPTRMVEHDGKVRLVRGYSNGRYGYRREDGVFVDLEPPADARTADEK